VAALVVVAAGFMLLIAAMQAGERGTRPFFNALAVLGVGGGLMAAGIALLIWEMSIRYDIRK
jgi:disulfide bond formation protein DsbB